MKNILYNRGIETAPAAESFFRKGSALASDFLRMTDLEKAAERILLAVKNGEPIVVYGDYDTDGVTSTAMLVDFLQSIGSTISPYIPNRFEEGYGLNCAALQGLAGQGAKLVITVDCGARSVEEAQFCKTLDLDLIITDHHSPGTVNPQCFAFLDPKRPECPYPDKDLAGVGVAFRLVQAIDGFHRTRVVHPPESYLDLVAIGTVADMAPLLGENRALVQAGLEQINRSPQFPIRLGLDHLLQVSGVRREKVDAATIGFILGPRLNAAGRLDTANTALQLLLTGDPKTAKELSSILDSRNRERQELTRATFLEAKRIANEKIERNHQEIPFFLMVEKENFNTGVIGLAASKLAEEFYRPCAVVAIEGEYARGSTRSIPGFHITEALDRCASLLERYGGHAAAAGFTVRTERLPELNDQMEQIAREILTEELLQPVLQIDSEVTFSDLDWSLLDWIRRMEPCGQGNPAPIFCAKDLEITSRKTVGKDGSHLKLTLSDTRREMEAIAFGFGGEEKKLPAKIDAAFALEENDYYGRQLQLRIKDIQEAEYTQKR
jgi:single-stranded-DNA-specific exonuclease